MEEYQNREHRPEAPVSAEAANAPEESADAVVEAFLPTDYFKDAPAPKRRPEKRKKRSAKRRRSVLFPIAACLLVGLLAAGGIYFYQLRYNPSTFFESGAAAPAKPSPTPKTAQSVAIGASDATPVPATPTPDPLTVLESEADASLLNQKIINVAVIGVDYAEERETWNGKHDYHADVIMIVAVNLEENRVDLISIPRDTYTNIPGVKGIYKINASLNCGGGMDAANGAGFQKVTETASWMLGGIPVNYYYAVTMPAVKGLVDAFGGVDYDLEMNFKMAGRSYKKGQQHMDGQAVLDYLRVRKNVAESGDLNRINRQKKMMVALFNQMKNNNLLLKIPDILSTFNGQLYTNCTASQTIALSLIAYRLNSDSIGMYSMGGTMKSIFNWNFCITDQENRVKIIRNVYGVDAEVEKEYAMAYANYRWQRMLATQYLATTKRLLSEAKSVIANGTLIVEQVPGIDAGNGQWAGGETTDPGVPNVPETDPGSGQWAGPEAGGGGAIVSYAARLPLAVGMPGAGLVQRGQYTQSMYDAYHALLSAYNGVSDALEYADKQAEKYLSGGKNSLSSAASSLESNNYSLKSAAVTAASEFSYGGGLSFSIAYEKDSDFNEIYVDFR